jgi:hypothetical protein
MMRTYVSILRLRTKSLLVYCKRTIQDCSSYCRNADIGQCKVLANLSVQYFITLAPRSSAVPFRLKENRPVSILVVKWLESGILEFRISR